MPLKNNEYQGVPSMSEMSETRLWKSLDTISHRLVSIEQQLTEVVRLQERVNSLDRSIHYHGKRLESHEARIQETELWKANAGDKASVERLVVNVQDDIKKLDSRMTKIDTRIDKLETENARKQGQRDIGVRIWQFVSALLILWIGYLLKSGG